MKQSATNAAGALLSLDFERCGVNGKTFISINIVLMSSPHLVETFLLNAAMTFDICVEYSGQFSKKPFGASEPATKGKSNSNWKNEFEK